MHSSKGKMKYRGNENIVIHLVVGINFNAPTISRNCFFTDDYPKIIKGILLKMAQGGDEISEDRWKRERLKLCKLVFIQSSPIGLQLIDNK